MLHQAQLAALDRIADTLADGVQQITAHSLRDATSGLRRILEGPDR